MNKYKLIMKTPSRLGNEYVYVYATSNFERYLLEHNLKYARDITQDYQLATKFNDLQQENKQLKEKYLNAVSDYEQEKAKNIRAIEYNNHLIKDAKYHLNLGHLKKMAKILKEDNNEQ